MANFNRRRQRKWRFSDGGNRFDGSRRQNKHRRQQRARTSISPAFKRGVRRCKRCRNRVVSNVDYCPFCGKSLLPIYQRLWFWLIVVVIVAVAVFAFVYRSIPVPTTGLLKPGQEEVPTVLNTSSDTSIKSLVLGTTIDVDGLQVTVKSLEDGPLDRNGQALKVLSVEFLNTRDAAVTLYSTQWMMQLADGTRVDTFIGSTAEGTAVTGNFEAYELPAQGRFVGRLYFAGSNPSEIVFQPTPLAYDEEFLVTWKTPELPPVP